MGEDNLNHDIAQETARAYTASLSRDITVLKNSVLSNHRGGFQQRVDHTVLKNRKT
jgi:hypothetical protein